MVITTEQIVLISEKSGEVVQRNFLRDLEGITKSLLQDTENFILHFKMQE